jgi:hypothetical protein
MILRTTSRLAIALAIAVSASAAFAQITSSSVNASSPSKSNELVRTGDAQPNTIYKHVDENGKVTYTNYPVRGGVKLDIDLVTVVSASSPASSSGSAVASGSGPKVSAPKGEGSIQPASAASSVAAISVPAVDRQTQSKRDDMRRRILEQELKQEEAQLGEVRTKLTEEQKNAESLKSLVQQLGGTAKSADATKAQTQSADRLAGLKVALADHERNVDAIKKELGALK